MQRGRLETRGRPRIGRDRATRRPGMTSTRHRRCTTAATRRCSRATWSGADRRCSGARAAGRRIGGLGGDQRARPRRGAARRGLVTEAESSLANVARCSVVTGSRERATAEYQLARSLLSHDPERAHRSPRPRRGGSGGSAARWALRAEAILLRARLAVGRIDRTATPVRVPRRLPRPGRGRPASTLLRAHGFEREAAALRLTEALAADARRNRGRRDARGARSQPDAARGDAARVRGAGGARRRPGGSRTCVGMPPRVWN